MNEYAVMAPGSYTPSLKTEFLEQVANKALGDLQQESTPIDIIQDHCTHITNTANRGRIPNQDFYPI